MGITGYKKMIQSQDYEDEDEDASDRTRADGDVDGLGG